MHLIPYAGKNRIGPILCTVGDAAETIALDTCYLFFTDNLLYLHPDTFAVDLGEVIGAGEQGIAPHRKSCLLVPV